MPYIFKQKLSLQDLVNIENQVFRILIYEPEEYLGAIYSRYLFSDRFDIMHCQSPAEVYENLNKFNPGLLIYNIDQDREFVYGRLIIKKIPELKVITTAYNINHEVISRLMSLGVVSHINRRFSRPQDLALLAKTLFNQI